MEYKIRELDTKALERDIEKYIESWDGTYMGEQVTNMYENGASLESICDLLDWDITGYEI